MDDWWSFDKVNGWQQKTSFPGAPRQYAAAASLGKYVYIFGGIDQNIISLNDFWRYDTENDSWENLTSLPSIGRQAPVIIPLYDKLLVGLGRNNITYFNDFWLYDPITDSFEVAASIPTAGRYYPIGQNIAGNAIVAHGWNQTECFNDAWRYDEIFDQWIQLENSPHAGCNYVASATVQNKLIMGGGKDYSNGFLNAYYEFDLATDSWKSLPDLPGVPRKGASMFTLDEEVYLVNGIDTSFTRLNEVWKLNLNDLVEFPLLVYPNPVYEWINIYLPEGSQELCESQIGFTLYDMTGRKVMEENFDFGAWNGFDLSKLKSGIYVFKLENCEGFGSVKIVVE
jgi:N-acetylneuraminic acid mutarotase